jgi:pyruvate,water dikinase
MGASEPKQQPRDPGGYIRWLANLGREDWPLVGGKSARLGELTRLGFRVPSGFVLTAAAYERFLDESGLRSRIDSAAERMSQDGVALAERESRRIREFIERAPIPLDIERAVRAAYGQLARENGEGDEAPPVAVRSSATAEDGEAESFAGQQDTSLWVRGAEDIVRHVRLCWASLYTPQAIVYRARIKATEGRCVVASMGVVVQRMVDATVAGVMFTLSPASGDRSIMAINASLGLGIGVVSGAVTPDEYWVDKVSMEIVKRRSAPKAVQFSPGGTVSGVRLHDVPAGQQREPCLRDEEVLELSNLGKRAELSFGAPQDIEWAIDRALPFPHNVFLLQSRPETVWTKKGTRTPALKPAASPVDYVLGALFGGATGRPGLGRPKS